MPNNTKEQKIKDARRSAWLYTLLCALSALMLLYLRQHYGLHGLVGAIMLLSALLDFGLIAPIWISFKERLKEIEGGEEDAAAEY